MNKAQPFFYFLHLKLSYINDVMTLQCLVVISELKKLSNGWDNSSQVVDATF